MVEIIRDEDEDDPNPNNQQQVLNRQVDCFRDVSVPVIKP
jgi:hypothetical protein